MNIPPPTRLQMLRVVASALALLAAIPASGSDQACNAVLPPITTGYGADGPYAVDQQSVDNPGFHRKAVQLFLPRGAAGARPVLFFAHGYGPNLVEGYNDLIHHLVSRGNVLVYSTYPALFASQDERYDALWKGFIAATQRYGDRMDLSRVGFVGHSFGGGVTPAMAWRGLVGQGWGHSGALMAMLAPWYSYQLSDAQLKSLPATVLQLFEVYADDTVNDPRMAIDLYRHSGATARYFFEILPVADGGCRLKPDHSTPGRNDSLRLKQYAVFRPLDALIDAAFGDHDAGRAALAGLGKPGKPPQVVHAETAPTPGNPESHYRFPWSDPRNPRR